MKITQILQQEHDTIRKLFSEICDTPAVGPEEQRLLFPRLRAELLAHSEAEEKSFYWPLGKMPGMQAAVKQGASEHRQLLDQLDELSTATENPKDFSERLHTLRADLERHLEHEEKEMFSQAQALTSTSPVGELADNYLEQKQEVLNNAPRS